MQHTIEKMTATPVYARGDAEIAGVRLSGKLSGVIVEIETSQGVIGHGFTAITDEAVVAAAVDHVAAPNLVGMNVVERERILDKLYWLLCPRGQTGYAGHVISAIDIAVWDAIGKIAGMPVWKMLGGARPVVPLYTTFGFASLERAELTHAARALVGAGHRRIKMIVGYHALARRNEGRPLDQVVADDVARVRAVREAVGDAAEIYIDANCGLDHYHALRLAERVADCDIGFFEEPIADNDPVKLADLRKSGGIPVATGQSEGQLFRFRDFLVNESVDILQPNVCVCGGFSVATRAAALAQAFGVPIDNGGTFPFHNMHLHGGLANGGSVEWHVVAVEICRNLFTGLPADQNGTLALPDTPGLGFGINRDGVREFSSGPGSQGHGKA